MKVSSLTIPLKKVLALKKIKNWLKRAKRNYFLLILGVAILGFTIGFSLVAYFNQMKNLIFSSWDNFLAFLGSLSKDISQEVEKSKEEKKEILATKEKKEEEEEQKEEIKSYIEKANFGEGITHLARRALKRYLKNHPQEFKLTPEHKVYIEDYLAREKGYHWIQLGEKMEFSVELIEKAISKAKDLTPAELENLSQYAKLVPSLNY